MESELTWNGQVTSTPVPVKANSCYGTTPAVSGDSGPLYSTIEDEEDEARGQGSVCECELVGNQAYIKSTSIPAVDDSSKHPEQFSEIMEDSMMSQTVSDYDYVVS